MFFQGRPVGSRECFSRADVRYLSRIKSWINFKRKEVGISGEWHWQGPPFPPNMHSQNTYVTTAFSFYLACNCFPFSCWAVRHCSHRMLFIALNPSFPFPSMFLADSADFFFVMFLCRCYDAIFQMAFSVYLCSYL